MIKLNDKEVTFLEGENLKDFLLRNNYDPDFLACEVNSKLVKKVDFEDFIVEDESNIEVFSFVGGG
ncbi:sulfur carrier protein ThiS [Anaerococcus marasmi]|uniref:sulfur carrier protein ThiS n=1 Tax=Anaerococcus marasmi TaxID=2057797 RepID=UPI000CFA085A|nr:sulfur carrier protein ThiS [Anaerococcus marasmi]